MRRYIIPILVPYSQKQKEWILYDNKEENFSKEDVKKIINEHLKNINKDNSDNDINLEISFMGGFSEKSIEEQEEYLKEAFNFISEKKANEIKVVIKPKYIDKKLLKMFKKYKVRTIELDVYSSNEYILKRIGIDHNINDIKKASRSVRFHRFKLGFRMVIGLPESTKIDDMNTAKTLVKFKPNVIDINSILVIKGTKLEEQVNQRKYKPLTLTQAIETCKELIKIYTEKNIEVSSVDFEQKFYDSEQIDFVKKIVDGPFHPAFRQLVESGLWYDAIVTKIKKLNAKVMEVEVTINPIDANNVIGYKQENILKLKDVYDVDLIVTPDESIKQGKSKIEITKIYGE